MNGSEINSFKFIIDTNVIFMSLYNPNSKAGKIIQFALENKIKLYSPDSVKEEIFRVLKRELNYNEDEIKQIILSLPIEWIEKQIYESKLAQTKVKHKPDKPIEALAITINCGIISANYHFKNRLDINKIIEEIENKNQ